MGLGKSVFPEALDLPEDLFGKFARITSADHSRDELRMEGGEFPFLFPGGHGASQLVCFAWAKPGGLYRQLHDLFLKDWHTQRAFQSLPHPLPWIAHGLQFFPAAQIRMHSMDICARDSIWKTPMVSASQIMS